jgi:beta-phosphoglucomutase-like phosphatase (HAD superfamily)
VVKAVIFDIDGTLIDSVDFHAAAWVEAFGHFGRRVTFRDVRKLIGKGGDQLMPAFLTADEIVKFGDA